MDRDLKCKDKFGALEFEAAIQMSKLKVQMNPQFQMSKK
jgi:hypothetical protein